MYISCNCGKKRQKIDAFPEACYGCLIEQHPNLRLELIEAQKQAKINIKYAKEEEYVLEETFRGE